MLTGFHVMRAHEVIIAVHLDTMIERTGQVLEMMLQLPRARDVLTAAYLCTLPECGSERVDERIR